METGSPRGFPTSIIMIVISSTARLRGVPNSRQLDVKILGVRFRAFAGELCRSQPRTRR
jgi:hypothetical protein